MTKRTLYADDCLQVLQDPVALPTESVDLIYLDPPFNSESRYNLPFDGKYKTVKPVEAFKDTWTWGDQEEENLEKLTRGHQTKILADIINAARLVSRSSRKSSLSAYLLNMAMRLLAMYRVLKPTGTLYLHCDPTASHYLKLVLDSIFGPDNFRNEIVWKRTSAHNDAGTLGSVHDVLLYYTKSNRFTSNVQFGEYSPEYVRRRYKHEDDDGRRWMDDNLTAKSLTGGGYQYEYKGVTSLWRVPPEKMAQLDAENRLYFTRKGGIRIKRYLDEMKGLPISDVWTDIYPVNSQAQERLGYPTQKPMTLLERIIKSSSNEGNVVLDPFCGCGTTIHAAESHNRQWIGVDISAFSVGLVRERLVTNFPEKSLQHEIETHGTPYDVATAKALARKDPFEFEKWVCGAIGAHGMFHDPGTKGRDGGVDGVIEFGLYQVDGAPVRKEHAIIQVKGGKVSPDHVKALSQTVEDFKGRAGIFVCFKEHLATVEQNRKRGTYADLTGKYPVIQGFSVEQLLKGEKPNLPPLIFRKDANLKQQKLGPLFDT